MGKSRLVVGFFLFNCWGWPPSRDGSVGVIYAVALREGGHGGGWNELKNHGERNERTEDTEKLLGWWGFVWQCRWEGFERVLNY